MTISVIIVTYNRADSLDRLLKELARQDGVPFEVVVVNGPSTDDTPRVLSGYAGRIKAVSCPLRNIPAARNCGLAVAGGGIVAFIDDDAVPCDELWLKRYADAFAADAGGRLAGSGGPSWLGDGSILEFGADGASTVYGFHRTGRPEEAVPPPDGKPWITRAQGCNCALRADILRQSGGFDEFYSYYYDETDIYVRLHKAGYNAILLPGNCVRHYPWHQLEHEQAWRRPWGVIMRSEFYFAMKNADDALPLRIVRTLALARRKWIVQKAAAIVRSGPWRVRLSMLARCGAGCLLGMLAGLLLPRRLVHRWPAVPPFLAFNSNIPGMMRE